MTKAIKNPPKTKKTETSPLEQLLRALLEQTRASEIGNTNTIALVPSKESKDSPKQQIQCKNWFFTWNNYPEDGLEQIEQAFNGCHKIKKYVFQPEIGDKNEVPHIQGAFWAETKMRAFELKLPEQIHWERTHNSDAAKAYCSKPREEGGLVDGGKCYMKGWPKPLKLISEFRPWMNEILLLIETEPNDRQIHWYWEPIGGVGKSQLCRYLVAKKNALCIQEGKRHDIAHLVCNAGMLENSIDIVLIDIPKDCGNNVSWTALEAIKNGMMTNMKYESKACLFNPPHIIVFSNFEPEVGVVSADRVIVHRI